MSLLNRVAEIAQELRRRHTITDDQIALQLEEAARLSAPPASGMRYAYVAANGSGLGYRWSDPVEGWLWTTDLSQAVHYATRADCEQAHAADEDVWHVYLVEVTEDEQARLAGAELTQLRARLRAFELVPYKGPSVIGDPWKEEATAIVAQQWCHLDTSGLIMNPALAEHLVDVVMSWMSTAAQYAANSDWHLKLLRETATHLPDERLMFDDTGKRCDEPFVSKVPEVVGELVVALGQASNLALYVEERAKGEMVKATKIFLSNQHTGWIKERLEAGSDAMRFKTYSDDLIKALRDPLWEIAAMMVPGWHMSLEGVASTDRAVIAALPHAVKALKEKVLEKPTLTPGPRRCTYCDGKGETMENLDGPNFPSMERCPVCNGKGVVP